MRRSAALGRAPTDPWSGPRVGPWWLEAARWVAALVLALHGLVHLMGVVLLWRLGEPGDLRYSDAVLPAGSPVGLALGALWLAVGVAFVVAGVLLALRRPGWRTAAGAAALVSVPVLALSTPVTATGLAIDVAVLLWLALTRRPRSVPAP